GIEQRFPLGAGERIRFEVAPDRDRPDAERVAIGLGAIRLVALEIAHQVLGAHDPPPFSIAIPFATIAPIAPPAASRPHAPRARFTAPAMRSIFSTSASIFCSM